MRILPVLDLKGGIVVHGVGGLRHTYQPLHSQLTTSVDPADVALALAAYGGFREFYVADLDAIAGAEPSWHIYAALQAAGWRLWLDAGVCHHSDARRFAAIDRIIVGLETLSGPRHLREMVNDIGERIVFSLDLRDCKPCGDLRLWQSVEPSEIVEEAFDCGIGTLIVLDLSRVGRGNGIGTEQLLSDLRAAHPSLQIFAGGGVRSFADMQRLNGLGLDGVLIASALHDGSLHPQNISRTANSELSG